MVLSELHVLSDVQNVMPSEAVTVFNENMGKLNDLLFTHMDYAAIGERL